MMQRTLFNIQKNESIMMRCVLTCRFHLIDCKRKQKSWTELEETDPLDLQPLSLVVTGASNDVSVTGLSWPPVPKALGSLSPDYPGDRFVFSCPI